MPCQNESIYGGGKKWMKPPISVIKSALYRNSANQEHAMPVLGIFAIGRFFVRIATLLWRKEEIRGLLAVTLGTILMGAWFYYQFEPTITTWVDAYYFTVITLTTIGYGDFSPTIPLTKLFTTVYVFVGLGIIAGLIGLVGEAVIEDANTRSKNQESNAEAGN